MTDAMQTVESSWHFALVGWPVWLVVPLAVLIVWAVRRLAARELETKPAHVRHGLLLLRGMTAGFFVLLFLEPTFSRLYVRQELPLVAVLVDTSGSMAVTDPTMAAHYRLNEAISLGLVPADVRDTAFLDAARGVDDLLPDAVRVANALDAPKVGSAEHDAAMEARARARSLVAKYMQRLTPLAPRLAGQPQISARFQTVLAVLQQAAAQLQADATTPPAEGEAAANTTKEVQRALRQLHEDGKVLAGFCREAQRAADAALVAAAEKDSPMAKGLKALGELSRFARVRQLVEKKLLPLFKDRARPKFMALASGLPPVAMSGTHADVALGGPTDFEAPLTALARSTGQEHLAGVLILSDGRQTAGGDPTPALRALEARGARFGAVMVGDPEPPRDAVIAEVLGSTEVFRGETVRLDVRYRITGFEGVPWDLILTRQDKEVDRRVVQGSGTWQIERFEFPAEEAGLLQLQVRLERHKEAKADKKKRARSGLLWEAWDGIDGYDVSNLTQHPRFQGKPQRQQRVRNFEGPRNWGARYGARLRGYLVPPQTGNYIFHIAADDKAELWLSTTDDPKKKTFVASVREWTQFHEWDKSPTQTSLPIPLRAGQRYYVEVLHKESVGGDHVSVGWTMPSGVQELPIPGSRLLMVNEGKGSALVTPEDFEESSLDNNQAGIMIAVNEDPLRALLVDAVPRWESRYVMTLLDRDRRVDLERRFRAIRLPRGEPQLLPDTQEKLDAYDMVIFGDLRPEELAPEDQKRLVDFVAKRGGFLVLLCGPRGLPTCYNLGGLADLLPVKVRGGGSALPTRLSIATTKAEPTRVSLTASGADHPIVSVLNEGTLNRKLWPALPGLLWMARNVTAKKSAEVLLESHDTTRTPVVALMRFGAGRVLYLGSDEIWRWRDRLGDRIHQTFWLQAFRWGLGVRLRGHDPRLQVSLDRSMMGPDEQAQIRARARNEDGSPLRTRITAEIQKLTASGKLQSTRTLELLPTEDNPDIQHQAIKGLEEGRWRIRFTADYPALQGVAETRELIVRRKPGREGVELGADLAALQRFAAVGDHAAGDFLEAESVVEAMLATVKPRERRDVDTMSLWDSYWVIVVALIMLGAEWVWRKRNGLP